MMATIAAVPACAFFLPGIHAEDTFHAVLTGVILSVVYLLLRPVAKLVTKVFTILTLGLLSVFIDAWLVQLSVMLMNGGLVVDSFLWAAAMAGCVNAVRLLVGLLIKKRH